MKHLEASIDIQAPVERVWQVLVDFNRYPEWNPFIIELKGRPEVGQRLQETLRLPDGKQLKLTSQVQSLEPSHRLVWDGYYVAPFLFSGRHSFILEATPEGTRFIQREVFTGLALFMMNVESVLPGYHQMNQALKARVEKQA